MRNTFGQNLTITLFGESHGEVMGAVLDGVAAGLKIDEEYIARELWLRRPSGDLSTARREPDPFRIVSGVFGGFSTGAPITVLIENGDVQSDGYEAFKDVPRPAHADYTANIKYHGFQDYRGGGRFSGRLTAPIVAAGAIVRRALEDKGILIGTHIRSLAGISDREISGAEDIAALARTPFPVLDEGAAEKMRDKIRSAGSDGDSVGGVLETVVLGMPAGVGEPFFDSVESVLSHGVFSIPGVKGVEFGAGFRVGEMLGSEANDPFTVIDGKVVTERNASGGVLGGISSGMPIVFRTAVKPTPSIQKEQKSVSLSEMQERPLSVVGRHDPAIVHRVRAVVDAMTALALGDLLTTQYGTEFWR